MQLFSILPLALSAPFARPLVDLFNAIADEAWNQGTPWLLLGLLLAATLARFAPNAAELRSRLRFCTLLMFLHLLFLPPTGLALVAKAAVVRDLRFTGAVLGALAAAALAGLIVFGVTFPRLRVAVPRILQDVMVAMLGTVAVFGTASRAGVDLTGIVATGAVLTAVIGLALQDTLGNVVGGLALQLDSTVLVGDWIRVQDVTGRVVEIRWRSTSIETRSWETVIIPNSVLTKTQVTVLGRRIGQEPKLRRVVNFNVDFRYTPSQVIELVQTMLRSQPIENVASTPEPGCILVDLGDSSARYAVRYWLQDLSAEDPTDSAVRTRIYFALTRAQIDLSMPAHAVFLTEDSTERRQHKRDTELARRSSVLSRIDLFRELSIQEQSELAASLHRAPFARGELLTREGADAHHLYMIYEGTVSVRVRDADHDREVAQLSAGQSFGEMSLLTGEKRSATVVALTDIDCYRLDASAFRGLLERHADLAAKVAAQLAQRRVGLDATRDRPSDRVSVAAEERDLLHKIREFFQL